MQWVAVQGILRQCRNGPPCFWQSQESTQMQATMSGTGALACYLSSVVVHDLVLHYSDACNEHSRYDTVKLEWSDAMQFDTVLY